MTTDDDADDANDGDDWTHWLRRVSNWIESGWDQKLGPNQFDSHIMTARRQSAGHSSAAHVAQAIRKCVSQTQVKSTSEWVVSSK